MSNKMKTKMLFDVLGLFWGPWGSKTMPKLTVRHRRIDWYRYHPDPRYLTSVHDQNMFSSFSDLFFHHKITNKSSKLSTNNAKTSENHTKLYIHHYLYIRVREGTDYGTPWLRWWCRGWVMKEILSSFLFLLSRGRAPAPSLMKWT